jgi:hypothetical protein
MVSRIFFASLVASDLDYDAKRWRLLADVTNDTALMIEVFCVYLPASWFIVAVSIASFFKAVTGVAGGAARASLTQHFAVVQNTADVSAKDGSQETAANLLGMLLGMLVTVLVPAESFTATASVFFFFTAMHLFFNYRGVRSLTISRFNRQRLDVTLDAALRCWQDLGPGAAAGPGGRRGRSRSPAGTPRRGNRQRAPVDLLRVPSPAEVSRRECVLLPHTTPLATEQCVIRYGPSLAAVCAALPEPAQSLAAAQILKMLRSDKAVVVALRSMQASSVWSSQTAWRYHIFSASSASAAQVLRAHAEAIADFVRMSKGTNVSGKVTNAAWRIVTAGDSGFNAFYCAFTAAATEQGWMDDRVQLRSEGWAVQN